MAEMERAKAGALAGAAEAWCIACGASSGAEEMPMALAEHFRSAPETLRVITKPDFVETLAERLGNAAWCIACGASKGAGIDMGRPVEQLGDAEVEALAKRLMPFINR